MSLEKRAIFAMLLSLAVLYLYIYFFAPKPTPKEPQEEPTTSTQTTKETQKTVSANTALEVPLDLQNIQQNQAQEQILEIATPLYKAKISNLGGRLVSWEILSHSDEKGQPVQMILDLPDIFRKPLWVKFEDENWSQKSLSAAYQIIEPLEKVTNSDNKETQQLALGLQLNESILMVKKWIFYPDNYDLDLEISFQNLSENAAPVGNSYLMWDPGLGSSKGAKKNQFGRQGIAYMLSSNKVTREKMSGKKETSLSVTGDISWLSVEDNYFTAAMIPAQTVNNVSFYRVQEGVFSAAVKIPAQNIPAGESISQNFKIYVGPKTSQQLAEMGSNLDKIVYYGSLDPLAKILLVCMLYINKFVHNFGVAIIILTVLIKIAFAPLTHAQMKSMSKMQKIQPEMALVRERFKKDPKKMNQEMMQLYKQHGVNPMGGCLPMLIQIPVLFALYELLPQAIELRHASFVFWIQDLASKDPYYVTPILMGFSMFLQQKLSPSSMDPKQARMMMFLPIIFTWFFVNFPAGLVLYWLVNNLLAIAQQVWMNRNNPPATVKPELKKKPVPKRQAVK